MSAQIEIAVEIVHMTEKAVLIFDGAKQVWIPKGAIIDHTGELETGEEITIFLSERMAEEKGLV